MTALVKFYYKALAVTQCIIIFSYFPGNRDLIIILIIRGLAAIELYIFSIICEHFFIAVLFILELSNLLITF